MGDAQDKMDADHEANKEAYVAMGEVDIPETRLTNEEWATLLEKFRNHEISDEQKARQQKYREKLNDV